MSSAMMTAASMGMPPSMGRHIHSPRLTREREQERLAAQQQRQQPQNPTWPSPTYAQGASQYGQQPGGFYQQNALPSHPQQGMYYQPQQQPYGRPLVQGQQQGNHNAEKGVCVALLTGLGCLCCLDFCIF